MQNIEKYRHTINIKIENSELKTVCNKNRTCYYFDDVIESKDFHNTLLDEK